MSMKIQKISIHMIFSDDTEETCTLKDVVTCVREPQIVEEAVGLNYTTSRVTGIETWTIEGTIDED